MLRIRLPATHSLRIKLSQNRQLSTTPLQISTFTVNPLTILNILKIHNLFVQLRRAHVLWDQAARIHHREASQQQAHESQATQAVWAQTLVPIPPPRWRSVEGRWRRSPPSRGSSRTTSTWRATTTTWSIWRRLRRHCREGFRQAVVSVKSSSSLSDSSSNQLLSHFWPSSKLVFVNYQTHTCICQLPDEYLYLSAGCLLVFAQTLPVGPYS